MKKIKYFILILVMMNFVGCGGEKKAKDEKVVLRFSWWGGKARHEATLNVINKYMEENPNVKIEAEYGGWDGYYQKISTQVVGGVAPDIMQLDQPWLPEMSKSNAFLNLYDYTDTLDLSSFNKEFLESNGKYGDKLLGLPTGFNGYVFLYNKKLNDKYDIKNNMTWNELIKIGEKIHKEDKDKYFLIVGGVAIKDSILRRIIAQETGETPISDDYKRNFDEKTLEKGFDILGELYSKNVIPPLVNTLPYENNMQEYPNFINGKIYGIFTLLSNIATIKSMTPDIEWDAVSLPVIKNFKDTGTWTRPSQVLSVSKNSKYPKEAVKFLNYFYNNEEAIKMLNTTRSIPSSKKALKILKEEKALDSVTSLAANILVEKSGLSQNLPEFETTLTSLDLEFINSIALGKYTSKAASDEYIKLYDKELENLRKKGN